MSPFDKVIATYLIAVALYNISVMFVEGGTSVFTDAFPPWVYFLSGATLISVPFVIGFWFLEALWGG